MHFVLTAKGDEELASRTYRLELKVRNILFLIQRGTHTLEAILQNSVVPREEVVEKLRDLLKDQFVSMSGSGAALAAPPPATPGRAPTLNVPLDAPVPTAPPTLTGRSDRASLLGLSANASMSQARFVLCDFCLDQFGMKAQALVDQINAAPDVPALQKIVDTLANELVKTDKSHLRALADRVREINEGN
jgi:hypothetical protein